MTTLDELIDKPREERTPLEQCIVDSVALEDMRDGDYGLQELAVAELDHTRAKRLDGISAYDIANAAVDELFVNFEGTKASRLELKDEDEKGLGGWAKNPARNIIMKHIKAALQVLK